MFDFIWVQKRKINVLSPTISNFGGQENWGGTEEVGNSNRLEIRTQPAEIQ